MTAPDFNPKNVVIAGFRIAALAFVVGMGAMLYTILTGSDWALFWWLFVALTVPLCVYFFFHETKLFYVISRDGNDWTAPEPRHRNIVAGAVVIALAIAAIYFYPY